LHALFAARAKCRDNFVITEARRKRFVRNGELPGINAKARQRAARAENAQGAFKRI
jgi:hypothetical protein